MVLTGLQNDVVMNSSHWYVVVDDFLNVQMLLWATLSHAIIMDDLILSMCSSTGVQAHICKVPRVGPGVGTKRKLFCFLCGPLLIHFIFCRTHPPGVNQALTACHFSKPEMHVYQSFGFSPCWRKHMFWNTHKHMSWNTHVQTVWNSTLNLSEHIFK